MWQHTQSQRRTTTGEVWTTEIEREDDVWVFYIDETLAADKYVVLISLSGPVFPHRIQGQPINRIDITSIYLSLDVAVNSKGVLRYGVVSRIDGTDADIWYFTALPFQTGANQQDQTILFRTSPSQLKLDLAANNTLLHGLSNSQELNVAAVNTSLALDSPAGAGSIVPARGDVVLKYEHVSGSTDLATFLFYHCL